MTLNRTFNERNAKLSIENNGYIVTIKQLTVTNEELKTNIVSLTDQRDKLSNDRYQNLNKINELEGTILSQITIIDDNLQKISGLESTVSRINEEKENLSTDNRQNLLNIQNCLRSFL